MAIHDADNTTNAAIDTVRLDPRQRKELMSDIERGARSPAGADARRWPRFGYEAEHIIVTITHPAGNTDSYLVVPRNLSVGGLAFIHGQFLHAKSRCVVVLPTRTGAWFRVAGRVIRCRHRRGMIHEVSVEFEERIDPDLFIDPNAKSKGTVSANANSTTAEPRPAGVAAPAPIVGRRTVLLVDDAETDRALFGQWLRQQGLTVVDAANDATALSWLDGRREIHLALLHRHENQADGSDLTRRIRQRGYKGPILTVSADGSDQARAMAMAAGCNAFLAKPCHHRVFVGAVSQLLFLADSPRPGPSVAASGPTQMAQGG